MRYHGQHPIFQPQNASADDIKKACGGLRKQLFLIRRSALYAKLLAYSCKTFGSRNPGKMGFLIISLPPQ